MPQINPCVETTNTLPPDIYTASLSTQLTYNINFPFLAEADVVVYLENPAGTFTLLTNSAATGASPPNYTIAAGVAPVTGVVTFAAGEAPGGTSLIIGRRTNICSMLVEYQVGASIRAGDLNLDNQQLLNLIQELRSTLGHMINGNDSDPIIPGQGMDLNDLDDVNVGDPVSPNPGVLRWNGTNWVSNLALESGVAWVSNNSTFATTAAGDARWLQGGGGTTDLVGGDSITVTVDSPSAGQVTIAVTDSGVGTTVTNDGIDVDSVNIWGQAHDHSAAVTGDMSSVGDITFSAGNRSLNTAATTDRLTVSGGVGAGDAAFQLNRDLVLNPNATTELGGRTYTWPTAALTANTVLTTDASGNLSWSDGSGQAGNLWELSGTDTRLKSATDDVLLRPGNVVKFEGSDDSSNARFVTIQAATNDVDFSSNYTLTLPDGGGSAGQVLGTTGGGVLAWQNPSSSTVWTRDGTDVHLTNNGDNVGIGTSTPGRKLDVTTTSQNVARFISTSSTAIGPVVTLRHTSASPADDDAVGNITFQGDNDNAENITFATIVGLSTDVSDSNEKGALTFSTADDGTLAERMRIDSAGRLLVGLESQTRSAKLNVRGNTGNTSGSGELELQRGEASSDMSNSDSIGLIYFNDNTNGNPYATISARVDGTPSSTVKPGRLVFLTRDTAIDGSPIERMRINSNGDVLMKNDLLFDNANADIVMNPGSNSGSLVLNRAGRITTNVNAAGNSNVAGANGGGAQIDMSSNDGIRFNTFPDTVNVNDAISLSERMRINSAGNVEIGGTPGTSPNIELNADGSGEFSGNVVVSRTSSTNVAFQATDGNAAQPKFRVRAGGQLTIGPNVADGDGINIQLDQNGKGTFAGGDIQLQADGNGSFAGDINAGDRDPAETDHRGVRIAVDSSNGGCYVQAKASVTPSTVMAFQALHGTNERFKVLYDGTAELADKLTIGNLTTRGQFKGTCPDSVTASSADAFVAEFDGDVVFDVKYDGSVDLDGPLDVGNSDQISITDAGIWLKDTGNASSSNFNIKLDTNGSAQFKGNVDCTGLPTSDPGVTGRLWNDSGTLKISS